ALVTLVASKALAFSNNKFFITDLGRRLKDNISTIKLPLVGYGNLLAKQLRLANDPKDWKETDIDYLAVAMSSIGFGSDLDSILLDLFRIIKPKGTICDLGCGTREKLLKICNAINTSGLGIERDLKVIKASQKFVK